MGKQDKRYYFRVQYQKGTYEISEKTEGVGYLPISEMIETILKFVVKVKNEAGEELGGKMALEGLKLIFKLCYNVDMDWQDTGGSKSKYINRSSAKNKIERSGRFDYEYQGLGGRDDLSNEVITRFIRAYKETVRK